MENALETSDYIPKQEIDMFNADSLYIPYSIQNELEILWGRWSDFKMPWSLEADEITLKCLESNYLTLKCFEADDHDLEMCWGIWYDLEMPCKQSEL